MLVYSLLITFFFIEIYRSLYPDEYSIILKIASQDIDKFRTILQPKIISICYNLVYYYSCGEIYFNKFREFIRPYIKFIAFKSKEFLQKNNIIKANEQEKENILTIEYYNNNESVYSFNLDILKEKIYIKECPFNYDFIVCTDYVRKENECVNKFCISSTHYNFDNKFSYNITNFKFMSLQIVYNDKNYNIDLKTDKFNFYIVNNIFDNKFFSFYLKHILNEEMSKNLKWHYNNVFI